MFRHEVVTACAARKARELRTTESHTWEQHTSACHDRTSTRLVNRLASTTLCIHSDRPLGVPFAVAQARAGVGSVARDFLNTWRWTGCWLLVLLHLCDRQMLDSEDDTPMRHQIGVVTYTSAVSALEAYNGRKVDAMYSYWPYTSPNPRQPFSPFIDEERVILSGDQVNAWGVGAYHIFVTSRCVRLLKCLCWCRLV